MSEENKNKSKSGYKKYLYLSRFESYELSTNKKLKDIGHEVLLLKILVISIPLIILGVYFLTK